MRHGDTISTLRQAIALAVTLISVLTIPVAPATAYAVGSAVSAQVGVSSAALDPAVEAPSVTALRTSGILAGVAIGVAALVGLWWYLVIRGRRK